MLLVAMRDGRGIVVNVLRALLGWEWMPRDRRVELPSVRLERLQ